MTEKEKLQIDTIKRIDNKEVTIKEAMEILKQTRRNINRLMNKYKNEGESRSIQIKINYNTNSTCKKI